MNNHQLKNDHSVFFALCTALSILPGTTLYAAGLPEKPPLFSHLLGGNEVGSTGLANAGDQDGTGSVTIIFKGSTQLCFALLMNGIDTPTAAHIHHARAGQNGPVVVPLSVPTDGNPGASSDCLNNLDPTVLADIRKNPAGYYVNIHTTKFPGGALRGQLF